MDAVGLSILMRELAANCESFENHLDKSGNFHEKLVQRLALDRFAAEVRREQGWQEEGRG